MAEPTTVTSKITFLLPPQEGEKAYRMVKNDWTEGDTNMIRVPTDVVIENIRGKEHFYTLDKDGFQLYNIPTILKNTEIENPEKFQEYCNESTELVKKLCGASRVHLFDYNHRRRQPGVEKSQQVRQPAPRAHIDVTENSCIARIKRHLPDEAPELLKKRYQIVNLWRPFGHPAYDWPLAFCTYGSSEKDDNMVILSVFPERSPGESLAVRYNPKQQWKYLRGMKLDEFVLLKNFDSLQDGSTATYAPHASFEDPSAPPDSPPRESVEMRYLVFYD